jgi:hypothetical protein
MPIQIGYITFQPQSEYYDKKSRSTFDCPAIPLGRASNEGKEERRISQNHMNPQAPVRARPFFLVFTKLHSGWHANGSW